MKKKQVVFFLTNALLVLFFLSGCHSTFGTRSQSVKDIWIPVPSTVTIANDLEAQHKILLAFAQGYPGKISGVEFLNNDWTMLVNGERFYYAHGRFLPERLRMQWENYHPYDFYT